MTLNFVMNCIFYQYEMMFSLLLQLFNFDFHLSEINNISELFVNHLKNFATILIQIVYIWVGKVCNLKMLIALGMFIAINKCFLQ